MNALDRIDQNITQKLQRLVSSMKSTITRQVPVRTGKLKRSLKFGLLTYSGKFKIIFSYNKYGVYTDAGTGRYKTVQQSPFNSPPFRGYRKGTMGIQPQYWTSMNNKDMKDLTAGITEIIGTAIVTTLKEKKKK